MSQYIAFESFLTAFKYASRTLTGKPYMAVGRNMAIRKALFIEVGGYDNIKNVTGGDDDLFVQLHATSTNTKLILGEHSLVKTAPEKILERITSIRK